MPCKRLVTKRMKELSASTQFAEARRRIESARKRTGDVKHEGVRSPEKAQNE